MHRHWSLSAGLRLAAALTLIAGLASAFLAGRIIAHDDVETWWTQLLTAFVAAGLGWMLVYLGGRAVPLWGRSWVGLLSSVLILAVGVSVGAATT